MRIKFVGKWYDIDSITTNLCDNIANDFEEGIEDIEINGRHLATPVESDVISAYPKGRITEGKYDVMNVTAESVKEAKINTKRSWKEGDEVMTIDFNGNIFHGKINELYGNGLCHLVSPDYKGNLIDIPTSKLVDDSDGADPNYTAAQIYAMQAEYWKEKAQRQADSDIDWEQRTFFLAAQIYVSHRECSPKEGMEAAKDFIDYYREETKL